MKFTLRHSPINMNKFSQTICLFLILFSFSNPLSPNVKEDNGLDAESTIDLYYKQISNSFVNNSALSQRDIEQQILEILDELIDFERLSPQIIQKMWTKIDRHEKNEFVKALKIAFKQKIISHINKNYDRSLPLLKIQTKEIKDKFTALHYLLEGKDKVEKFSIFMLKYPDGEWKVTNVKIAKNSLRRYYYSFCQKILKKYSLAYLNAELSDADYVMLEDFEAHEVGRLPDGWLWKKSDENKNKPYKIKIENGNKYLAAEDNGESVILGKDVTWNLKKYPYISFKWRAHHLPEGGDERYSRSVDSGAAIYIIYKKKLGLIPVTVKYVWSTTLPVGAAMIRSGIGRPWMVVAESGDEHLGEWRTYVFNAYEAYKKTFGGSPPGRPIGIGILSDANSTHSKAYADYDDIRVLKLANADSGVKEIIDAE